MMGSWMTDNELTKKIVFMEQKKDVEKLSDEERQEIWQLTKEGIDLEDVEKLLGDITETIKPIFELYTKNINTYLKYKK